MSKTNKLHHILTRFSNHIYQQVVSSIWQLLRLLSLWFFSLKIMLLTYLLLFLHKICIDTRNNHVCFILNQFYKAWSAWLVFYTRCWARVFFVWNNTSKSSLFSLLVVDNLTRFPFAAVAPVHVCCMLAWGLSENPSTYITRCLRIHFVLSWQKVYFRVYRSGIIPTYLFLIAYKCS